MKCKSIIKSQFVYYYIKGWWDYGSFSSISFDNGKATYIKSDYIEDLKSIAPYQGYSPDEVDELITVGFTIDEIEDYLYCGCGGEI